MTKVIASDVASANSNNMSALNAVMDSSQATVSVLNAFVYESTDKLKGGGYNSVRKKLSLYVEAFKTLHVICENYMSIAKNANNSMLNYMEGYASLDDSKLDEYKVRLKQIEGYLRYLREQSSKVDSGNDYASLISYWDGIYKELYHYKELLEKLKSTDTSLYGAFEKAITDIENISRCAIGIDDGTFTQSGMEAFRKNGRSLYNYNPKLGIFRPNIDTTHFSSRAKKLLEELERNWPSEGFDAQRYIAIQTALELLDKGITYSQSNRHGKKNGWPTQMDCSSFVTYCLMAAGQKIAGTDKDAGAYTGTYLGSKYYNNINRSELTPGDIALANSSTSGGNSNHIGLYLGTDDKGREVWIEVGGGVNGVGVHYGNRGWSVFKRYNDYDDKDDK